MSLGKSIGIPFRRGGGFNWTKYWSEHLYNEEDIIFRYNENTRSGLVLPNAITPGTGDALLLPAVYLNKGGYYNGDKTRVEEKLFNGGSYTVFCEMSALVTVAIDNVLNVLSLGSNTTTNTRGIFFFIQNKSLRSRYGDGIITGSGTEINYGLVNSVFIPEGRFYLFITINFATKIMNIGFYDSVGTLIVTSGDRDISALTFNDDNNYYPFSFSSGYFGISNFKKFNAIETLSQCLDNTYTTDLQLHYPVIFGFVDLASGKTLSGNTTNETANFGYSNHTLWLFDYGYDRYIEKSSANTDVYKHIYVPKSIAGVSQTYSKTNFMLLDSISGNLTGINPGGVIAGYKIRFSQDFFDRSNVAIWNDACRASAYYDTGHTKDFHSSELNYRTLYGYLNDGYVGKFYPHFENCSINLDNSYSSVNRVNLKNLCLYNTDNKGIDNAKVLQYTGDIAATVLDVWGNFTYDANNYIKIGTSKSTKPMAIIRFDDGLASQTGWLTLLNSYGIVGNLAIITDLIGTAGYMTWTQIKTFAEWEVMSHGKDATSVWEDLTLSQIDEQLSASKSAIEVQGLQCLNFATHATGHVAGLGRYLSREYYNSFTGYKNITGEVGCNPLIVDPYDLRIMIMDMVVGVYPYNIEDAGGMVLLKSQLDLCVAENRIAEIVAHNYTEGKATALSEVIEYAIAHGISIVTRQQALDNCKFL